MRSVTRAPSEHETVKILPRESIERIRRRLERLYGPERAPRLLSRLTLLAGRYECPTDLCGPRSEESPVMSWDQRDAMLITYGNMVRARGEQPLVTLRRFLDEHIEDGFADVHILPFFPYSSEDGFSVIDYRNVNDHFGSWADVEALSNSRRIMFNLIVNHVSRKSSWFKHYVNGTAPYRHYFISEDPNADLSAVVRPRSTPLLRAAQTRRGVRHLWTTFNGDQVDLRWRNPDVLFEFLDILLYYVSKGARIIRLDNVAFLWKQVGTTCVHLQETHEIVKLFRDVLHMLAPGTLLLADANAPSADQVSYFGDGDEAQLVCQCALPALILHALHRGTSRYLKRWLASQKPPPPGCTFVNYTATQDGICVEPLEGVVPDAHLTDLIAAVEERGGYVSTRSESDGSEKAYELNITYFDALSDPGEARSAVHVARFLCSQFVMLALKGIPAVYFHSLTATHNDQEGVNGTGEVRAINRKRWDEKELLDRLQNPKTPTARVFHAYLRLLRLRAQHPSFHPDGAQRILDINDGLLGIERTSPDGLETIIAVSNLTSRRKRLVLDDNAVGSFRAYHWEELITGRPGSGDGGRTWQLAPYECVWLRTAKSSSDE